LWTSGFVAPPLPVADRTQELREGVDLVVTLAVRKGQHLDLELVQPGLIQLKLLISHHYKPHPRSRAVFGFTHRAEATLD
jgi:hypothetical protein